MAVLAGVVLMLSPWGASLIFGYKIIIASFGAVLIYLGMRN
ncbi:MAG: hypothetical protein ACOCP4_04700 [Candidatus Woesearchaeota archaeon]